MDKLKMHTPDIAEENYKKLAAMFPNAVTETIDENGEVVRAIDADVLRQEISAAVVEGNQERYQFTWPDKKKSVVLANQPIAKTLRLDRSKSVGRDGTPGSIDTENIYIEGDNLDALKLLQETYLGKVKMIYIDPPYNTGNDFVYEDDFRKNNDEYLPGSGQFDDQGNQLVQNTESNGRFHTDWLNMLYPRLRIARDLLTDDGVIFISIDDNEIENLRKVCDELFGIQNFIAQLSVIVKTEGRQYGHLAKTHEYILVYSKSDISVTMNQIRVAGGEFRYYDEKGGFNTIGLRNRAVRIFNSTNRPNLRYPFYVDDSHKDRYGFSKVSTIPKEGWIEVLPSIVDGLESVWRWGKETAEANKDELVALRGNDNQIRIYKKDRDLTTLPKTVWFDKEFNSIVGTREVAALLGKGLFDFPKPIMLIKQLVEIATNKDSLVLDFFSGSATTAHAVMQLNAEDGGNRKFILVQLPEATAEKSEARKAGYETICEIGEERIRRAGAKIREELAKKQAESEQLTLDNNSSLLTPHSTLDTGFRVFRVDSSNMENVYYSPADFDQAQLELLADNIKPDRTPEDLLFQVMLDLGILLSSEIEETEIDGKKVFSVAGGYLIACFDNDVTEETVKAIAKMQPFYAVFRDSSMATDSVATNFEQIFETYSPKTVRRVI